MSVPPEAPPNETDALRTAVAVESRDGREAEKEESKAQSAP
jgi:hypothetical protein